MTTILVTGSNGQLGTVLVKALKERYGSHNIIASDIREGSALMLDVLDMTQLSAAIRKYKVSHIYHLAAILSAKGEANPLQAWNINMQGLLNILEAARLHEVAQVFFPSTIAVFGSDAPKIRTPNQTILHPSTVYGIAKAAGESWCQYYHQRYGLDVRSLRYPGIISWQSAAGGGTTDYAMEMFASVDKATPYHCFLKASTRLPMIYIDDAIRATLELMEAPSHALTVRTSYNIAGVSFTPGELATEIRHQHRQIATLYTPDFRQQIADNWPRSIDDYEAHRDWGWKAKYNLPRLVKAMLEHYV